MTSSASREAFTAETFSELQSLYRAGRFFDAYRRTEALPRLEDWPTVESLVLAGRFVSTWGDAARSNRLHDQAYRRDPANIDAIYFRTITAMHKHGVFAALMFLRPKLAALEAAPPSQRLAYLWLLQARLLGWYRDFVGAGEWLARAEPVIENDAWLWVEKACLFERQDRYAEGLAAAQRALELRPWYRPAVETAANALQLLNRADESLDLLVAASDRLQSGSVLQSLVLQLLERERFEEVLAALERAGTLLPLADRSQKQWLAARRADALYRLNRYKEAREQALLADNGYHRYMAERLAAPPEASRRVLLAVGFVRQHHMTCAPATLAAIGAYWGREVDHLELARVICYDGTPDHEERHWAETHGWRVREFRVTWETAVALLDRGCPFTLTTVATRSAHLQAVVGYDATLGTLLIRDPYHRIHGESVAKLLLEAQGSSGPRGMVFLPEESAEKLDGIPLPDAELYDLWFALRRALAVYDGKLAERHAAELAAKAPGHRMDLFARRELASYDGNLGRLLESVRALRALFPDDASFQLDEIQTLQSLGRRAEARDLLRQRATTRGADPLFWRNWAEELRSDARDHDRARRLVWRALRVQSLDANHLRTHANLLWDLRNFDDATLVYRLAASAADKTEQHWTAWFAASRHVQTVEQSLGLLRQRFERLGAISSQPARTLFGCFETLDRGDEAFRTLDRALELRPDDGELLLFAAEVHGRYGRGEQAGRLLQRAEGRAARGAWLRTAAQLAGYRTQHDEALKFWREYIATSPVDLPAHREIARLVLLLEGRAAALAFLTAACTQHPHNVPLQALRLEWLRNESPDVALVAVEALLALDPANAWALREKALILRQLLRFEEARALAEEALRIEPRSPDSHGTLGHVLLAAGNIAEARVRFQDGLRLWIEAVWLFSDLINASPDFAARREAVTFLHGELMRQPAFGDAALRFREVARGVLPPEELLVALRSLWEKFPGTWTTWSALSRHLLEHGKADEALEKATEAVRRFPLIPLLRFNLALVHSHLRRGSDEIACLQEALELSPAWGAASRHLALAHERALDLEKSEHVLRRAIAANPMDARIHATLAELVHRRGRPAEAREQAERAVHLDPSFDWPWQLLYNWSADRGKLAELAQTLTRERPGEAASWIRVARFPAVGATPDERLGALDKALVLEPGNMEAHDFRAELLGAQGRFDEALAGCAPSVFGGRPPRELQGRAAWLEAERGNLPVAIARMRTVVDAHPDYGWGWARLTEWLWQNGEFQQASEAGTKWSWLEPESSVAHGYVASAHLRLNNRTAAKEALQRALHTDPTYAYGAQLLLQLHAEDSEAEAVKKILEHVRVHLPAMEVRRAEVRWHILRKDRTGAREALAAMSACPPGEIAALNAAARAMFEAGWAQDVEAAFENALADPGTHPEIGALWGRAWTERQEWSRLRQLKKRGATEPVARNAYGEFIDALGKRSEKWRLRWLCWRKGEWLRADVETWGAMGNALVNAQQSRAGVSWLRDWKDRPDAKPWMLHNLVQSYYALGKPQEAMRVIEAVLRMPPDHTRSGFLVWQALELGLAGEMLGAGEALGAVSTGQLSPYMTTVRHLADALNSFQRSHAAKDASALAAVKDRLAQLKSEYPMIGSDPALSRFRQRVLRRVARETGSWSIHMQSWLRGGVVSERVSSSGPNAFPAIWMLVIMVVLLRSCLSG